MKKVLSLCLVVVMLCSFAACGGNNDSSNDTSSNDTSSNDTSVASRNPEIVDYMTKNANVLMDSMESSFASSSGMTCRSTWEVVGNGLILNININELEDLSDEQKSQMQSIYDSNIDQFAGILSSLQTVMPDLEYCDINVCEQDGDIAATIALRPTE